MRLWSQYKNKLNYTTTFEFYKAETLIKLKSKSPRLEEAICKAHNH